MFYGFSHFLSQTQTKTDAETMLKLAETQDAETHKNWIWCETSRFFHAETKC
jgi:hypothetical protein